MDALLALLIGVLYACGVYLLLQRGVVKIVLGFSLLGYGANLLLFASGGVRRLPPLVGEEGVAAGMADPVPQALILTAIVIGFGVSAFVVVLVKRLGIVTKTADLDQIREPGR